MGMNFDKIADILNQSKEEQCVVLQSFLDDLDISPDKLSEATNRKYSTAIEIRNSDVENMGLKSPVFVFNRCVIRDES